MIYLDTHVVVWLAAGASEHISRTAGAAINENDVAVSPIVRLELQYLHEIQRIHIDPETILNDLAGSIGLKICNKNFDEIMLRAVRISWTRDPFDRIIVANASLDNSMLLTKDRKILNQYDYAIY